MLFPAFLAIFGHPFVRREEFGHLELWIIVDSHGEFVTAIKGEKDMPTKVYLCKSPTEAELEAGNAHPMILAAREQRTAKDAKLRALAKKAQGDADA